MDSNPASKKSSVMADINMTPMVDVMLVLLIIFMLITPALMAGFTAQMPTGENLKEREDDENRTTLGIDIAGNYYVNKEPIDKTRVVEILEAEMASHPEDAVLFLKADRNLKYGELREAMEHARKAGFRVMAAVTDPAKKKEDESH
jgi:biopolymer transport protein ExbD